MRVTVRAMRVTMRAMRVTRASVRAMRVTLAYEGLLGSLFNIQFGYNEVINYVR